MPPNDADESANHQGSADVGEPRQKETMDSEREGEVTREVQVASEEEGTTVAGAAVSSSGDDVPMGEGGGARGRTASSIAADAAVAARRDQQDQDRPQREEYGDEDDVVTATWSLDSDGRPVSIPHSWHPSVHEGGGGLGPGGGARAGEVATTMPPGGGRSHSRRGAHASSFHRPFQPVRSSAGDQFRGYPATASGGMVPAPPAQFHGYNRQDQQDYRYHGNRSASSITPQSRHHAPPPHEHGGYRAPPQFVDRRHPHDQQQPHRDYQADRSAGVVGGGSRIGGHYYPQEEQQQPYHARRTDLYRHSPTGSAYPPSNQSIHPPPHHPPTQQAAITSSSSSSLLQIMQRQQHHPTPYPPQMLSMNVGTVAGVVGGGGDNSNKGNVPLLSTRQRNPYQKGCSCRKTRCLKLYCQCFAASVLCSTQQCICDGCQNTEAEAYRGDRGAIALARRQVLVRNPNAFENKFLENNVVAGGAGADVGGPCEGGLESDDAGDVAVKASKSIETTKSDEEKEGDVDRGEEKASASKDDTTKSSEPASSCIKQEVNDSRVYDPREDKPEKETKIDSQLVDADVVVLHSEREAGEEERETLENDNVPGGSSSSVSTFKSLEPSSMSSFSKPSFESNNVWYHRVQENDAPRYSSAPTLEYSRSWELERRQRGGSYSGNHEARNAVIDHYYNQHHPSMRGSGYNQDCNRGFDHPSHRGNSLSGGMQGGSAQYPSSGMRPYPAMGHQYPGGGPPVHHVVQSHQPLVARHDMGGDRGHVNMGMHQMQSIPSKIHRVGCKCKKSKCLKKYCECFSNGIKCASHCKCENCGNMPEGDRPGNPQGSSVQPSLVNDMAPSSDQSIEMSLGQTLHMVSSEEDKISITTSVPSLADQTHANLDDDQYSKEGSINQQEIKTVLSSATVVLPSGTSDDDKKLDFLATLASSALDTLNADANNAAKKRQIGGEEDQVDQQETTRKRRLSSGDSNDPRKKYMAEQLDQQRHHHGQQHYQYHAPQASHYDQYVRHHPQYDERGGHSAYQHQGSHHQQQHHHWPSVQHQVDSRSFAPGGQQGHSHGAPYPQGIRPQFSRYQPPQPHNSTAQHPTIPTSTTAVHVPENIASALVAAHLKNKLPKGLTYRKVCSHCGRQRAEHGEFGFGNKCPFTTCGRCSAEEELHRRDDGTCCMGVMCTLTVEEGAKRGANDKYEAMLADLAARAEVRAGMTIATETNEVHCV
ncbi:hypothetical protein ACHAW5_002782 [Stephanodiscus triporus]|uniref:CRC domain-containing protein n=1 Tax=Stephanodiscus triporus TaxID=2934178 RepID=A0ABD3MHJ9_9STRA